jgi:uncharacterized DUF497 family protein
VAKFGNNSSKEAPKAIAKAKKMIHFEWDPSKDAKNLRERGFGFAAVRPVFLDQYRITEEDSVVDGEQRWRTIGTALGVTVVIVIHLEENFRGDTFVRIISARKATPAERIDYEQNRANDIG